MDSKAKKFSEINTGDLASFSFTVTESAVNAFGKLSGDENPLHMEQSYAEQTPFGQRVVHGMFGGALISQLIGMYLPGKYALYLKQTLIFKKPIFIGMELEISGQVTKKVIATKTIEVTTQITCDKVLLVDGVALVQVTQ